VCLLTGLSQRWAVADNLLCHFEEHLVNIAASLRRRLEELESVLFRQSLASLRRNHSVGHISFVGDENFGNSATRMCLDLLEPVGDVVKSTLFSTVIHQHDSHCALVISLSNRSEPLLTGRVPHLQLHSLILHINRLDLEVDS
jgi:hypothetical protein